RRIRVLKEEAALILRVVLVLHANRETALVRDDGGYLPSVGHFAGKPGLLGNGQFPNRAEHKSVLRSQQGQSTHRARIDRVEFVLDRGTLVNRLAKCVRGLEHQSVREVLFQGSL